jgi:hypothetical protein
VRFEEPKLALFDWSRAPRMEAADTAPLDEPSARASEPPRPHGGSHAAPGDLEAIFSHYASATLPKTKAPAVPPGLVSSVAFRMFACDCRLLDNRMPMADIDALFAKAAGAPASHHHGQRLLTVRRVEYGAGL